MPRELRLTRLFLRARQRHQVVAGTKDALAIVRTLNALAQSLVLPCVEDLEVLLPPAVMAWEHRVSSTHFSVVSTFDQQILTACTLRIP